MKRRGEKGNMKPVCVLDTLDNGHTEWTVFSLWPMTLSLNLRSATFCCSICQHLLPARPSPSPATDRRRRWSNSGRTTTISGQVNQMAEWPYGRFHACNYSWWLCLSSSHLADKHEHTAPDKLSLSFSFSIWPVNAATRTLIHLTAVCSGRAHKERMTSKLMLLREAKKLMLLLKTDTHTSTRNINLEANRQSQTDDLLNLQEKNW